MQSAVDHGTEFVHPLLCLFAETSRSLRSVPVTPSSQAFRRLRNPGRPSSSERFFLVLSLRAGEPYGEHRGGAALKLQSASELPGQRRDQLQPE